MSEFSSGVTLTTELLKQQYTLQEFVLDRYRAYLDAVYTNPRYDTRGYDVDSWLPDSDGDMVFSCSDSEGDRFELHVSLSMLDVWSMGDDEFKALLPELKKKHQAWVKERVEEDAAKAAALKAEHARTQREWEQRERDRIFREEAKRRGIEVPS